MATSPLCNITPLLLPRRLLCIIVISHVDGFRVLALILSEILIIIQSDWSSLHGQTDGQKVMQNAQVGSKMHRLAQKTKWKGVHGLCIDRKGNKYFKYRTCIIVHLSTVSVVTLFSLQRQLELFVTELAFTSITIIMHN